jgi:TRAP-type mannitol/chloroaromatic compound transport system substrate-binding protein
LQAADAVQSGTVECAHTPSYFYFGKDPTFGFATGLPFGLNARQQNAWLNTGGGNELLNEFFAQYNIIAFPAGNSGAQMGGFFRKEIRTVQDLQGLKFRIGGIGGLVLSRLGVVPQQIAPGDVYPALERGTIDANELINPYDDEKAGFARIAPYYYYPGWWEPGPSLHLFVNKAKWDALPKTYQSALRSAASVANEYMLNLYDVRNTQALRRIVASGAQLRPFSTEILDASYKAAFDMYEELKEKNANWRKVYEPWLAFRREAYLWFRVNENTFENYVYAQQSRG